MLQTLEMPTDNFFQNKEIIYIVYPAGTAGDLLSVYCSIQKNAIYQFEGFNEDGRTICTDSIFCLFKNKTLKNPHNYSKVIQNLDILKDIGLKKKQTIIVNSHFYTNTSLEKFFTDFNNINVELKVIRINLSTQEEENIRLIMCKEKLGNEIKKKQKFISIEPEYPNVLEISFKDLLINTDCILDQINNFLDVKIEIANRGLFNIWKSKQPDSVKQAIKEIYGVDYG